MKKGEKEMASRPVFYVKEGFVRRSDLEFEWFPGFAVSQKQKCIRSLHAAIRRRFAQAQEGAGILEISTKSEVPLGASLSAFRLRLGGSMLESVYHSAKVFAHGGPFPDLLGAAPRDAKRDPRLQASGPLTAFRFRGEDWPLLPRSAFYDYLYCLAAAETLSLDGLEALGGYAFFTDIEFNPNRGVSTQARSAALVRALLERESRGEAGVTQVQEMGMEGFLALHRAIVRG